MLDLDIFAGGKVVKERLVLNGFGHRIQGGVHQLLRFFRAKNFAVLSEILLL